MRGCLAKVLAALVVVGIAIPWLASPPAVAAHDVERDGITYQNVYIAYPFIGNVSGFNKIGGGVEVVIPLHGRVFGQWQCAALGVIGPVYTFSNIYGGNSDGVSDRTISVTVPDVQSTTYPGAMEPGERCWYVLQAVRSADNVFAAQPFDVTDAYWWGDIPGDDQQDPNPEATPSPTPTPTPPEDDLTFEATCQVSENYPTPFLGQVQGPPVKDGDVVSMSVMLIRAPGSSGRDFVWTSGPRPSGTQLPSTNPVGGWKANQTSPTLAQGSGTSDPIGPYVVSAREYDWPDDEITYVYCQNYDDNAGLHGDRFDITWTFHSGPSYDEWLASQPSPDPSPSPTPSPTPRPPGTSPDNPDDSNGGFDVCDSQYSASEKQMCQPAPQFPEEVGADMCEGADDASLAGCQPVEPWQGPTGGAGGGGGPGAGAPVGGGTGSSGLAECEPTPVEQKMGFVPYVTVATMDDLAMRVEGKDPIAGLGEALGWMGDMVLSLPGYATNMVTWLWNQIIDAFVPGACLGAIIASHWEDMGDTLPLSLFFDVKDAIDGAIAGAGAVGLPGIPLPGGGSIAFPLDEWEGYVAPYRGVLGAAVYLGGALYVFRVVSGTFGVAKGPEQMTLGL
jgi:hypothetical protein